MVEVRRPRSSDSPQYLSRMFYVRHTVAPVSFRGCGLYTNLVLTAREFCEVKVKREIDIPYLREFFLRGVAAGLSRDAGRLGLLDSSFFSSPHGS